jgi:hypothetical protein
MSRRRFRQLLIQSPVDLASISQSLIEGQRAGFDCTRQLIGVCAAARMCKLNDDPQHWDRWCRLAGLTPEVSDKLAAGAQR